MDPGLTLDLAAARDLGVAALAGLAVGIEREWSGHASGPEARFAGARTFLLLGLVGGMAGWLSRGGLTLAAATLLAGAAALVVAAYVMASRRGDAHIDGTTEVAALAVLALGAAAGLGFPLLTSAAASVMVLALAEKTRIHTLVSRIGAREMSATLQFAVLALVLLPLLPTGPYGPYDAIRPRALWAVVLLLSGISFAGYIARRAVGETRGYGITGMLGGIVSSTAVTLSFGRQSRVEPGLGAALALGVVTASTIVVPRVLVVSAAVNPAVSLAAAPYLLPALAVGAGIIAVAFARSRRNGEGKGRPPEQQGTTSTQNPLGLSAAIKMALGFQLALLAIPWVQGLWGSAGVLSSAVFVGIVDMDALAISLARLGTTPEATALAARGIAVGALTSTLFKLAVAVVVGARGFRLRVTAGLLALTAALALGFWIAG